MPYKVCLVEDEIVTREGIRDNVNWQAHGFEFAGDAPDGEMALPLLRLAKPDLLITDIKMPFMDGLQLCKIVRETMPDMKIIILSGHDEFEYAQEAIKLGVTEYLLKPVTVQDLHDVLHRIAAQLDQERAEQEKLLELQKQVQENQALLREKFLLKLIVGALSSSEAIEQSHSLGLDLVARCYLVMLVKAELRDRSEPFDYEEYKHIFETASNLVCNDPDVFLLQKDWENLVFVVKGNAPEFLAEQCERLAEALVTTAGSSRYQLKISMGKPKGRIAEIRQSFMEALMTLQGAPDGVIPFPPELLNVNRTVIENYLRSGIRSEFRSFFQAYLQPLGNSVLSSAFLKHYILAEIILCAARLISELGGNVEEIMPQLNAIERISSSITRIEQLEEQVLGVIERALAFRDSQNKNPYAAIVQQAKDYLAEHYADADLSLSEVASQVNLSASHFSLIFSQGTGQNFKEYLTDLRIQKAKELLRTTPLKTAEIAYRVGYNDPHYFSSVFHKMTGQTPTEFRGRG